MKAQFSSMLMLGLVTTVAEAGPVYCNPADGHCYEHVTDGLHWTAARDAALQREHEGHRGHLLTITSAAEQQYLADAFPGFKGWLGGFQPFDDAQEADPTAGWQWVTGEPFAYASWACGQPDDFRNVPWFPEGEDFLEMIAGCEGESAWNDAPGGFDNAYYVEYEPPQDLVESLREQVAGLAVPTSTALDQQLAAALAALDRGSVSVAQRILIAFIHSVDAQRGTQLTDAQADSLIAAARALLELIAT